MSDWTDFVNAPKGVIVAAAGHGKTYAIGSCLNVLIPRIEQPALILTHTNAGVASIRKKIAERKLDYSKCTIETIHSFSQKYVLAFYCGTDLPSQEDKSYFEAITRIALQLFSLPSIKGILSISYSHLFVDEYQDCSEEQHRIVLELSKVLPTHIFGDPLQGIFKFNSQKMVDMSKDLAAFIPFELLNEPWRWKVNNNNEVLGEQILECRKTLLEGDHPTIELKSNPAASYYFQPMSFEFIDYNDPGFSTYTNKIRSIINFFNKTSQSILILVPSFFDGQGLRGKLNDRMKLKTRFDFEDQFILLDAIDQKEYYDRAKEIDHIITSISSAHKKYDRVTDLLKNLSFKSKDIFPWIRDNHVVKKTKEERELSAELDSLCTSFFTSPSLSGVKGLIDFFSNRLSLTVKLPSVLHAERQCISAAIEKGASVYSCMVEYKNRIRKGGRKIEGSCIGTTLLTKGLEFDNVLVLDAHRIVDKENFYVAISRACKNLVIVSKSPFLSF